MSRSILKVENATMQFGGVVAVDNLNLEVNEGEIVALIGPNGAGKTTAFNVITGVYQPTNGAVWFQGGKIVENHPQGKMEKIYKGSTPGRTPTSWPPRPTRSPSWVWPAPSRTSGFGSPSRCLTTCSSPCTAAPIPTFWPPPSA